MGMGQYGDGEYGAEGDHRCRDIHLDGRDHRCRDIRLDGRDHRCRGIRLYNYSLHIYLYIAKLMTLHEIKSAMDIAMK